MNNRYLFAVPLAAVLMLACSSGDPKAKDGPTPSGTPTSSTTAAPGTTPSAGQPSTGSTPGAGSTEAGSGATPGATTGATTGPTQGSGATPGSTQKSHIELNAWLSTTCIVPGNKMTITLRARPKMDVIFNTRYSGEKEGREYGGFENNGLTDENGNYSKTWMVSPAAMPGEASTIIAAVDKQGTGSKRLPFRVARSC